MGCYGQVVTSSGGTTRVAKVTFATGPGIPPSRRDPKMAGRGPVPEHVNGSHCGIIIKGPVMGIKGPRISGKGPGLGGKDQ